MKSFKSSQVTSLKSFWTIQQRMLLKRLSLVWYLKEEKESSSPSRCNRWINPNRTQQQMDQESIIGSKWRIKMVSQPQKHKIIFPSPCNNSSQCFPNCNKAVDRHTTRARISQIEGIVQVDLQWKLDSSSNSQSTLERYFALLKPFAFSILY